MNGIVHGRDDDDEKFRVDSIDHSTHIRSTNTRNEKVIHQYEKLNLAHTLSMLQPQEAMNT